MQKNLKYEAAGALAADVDPRLIKMDYEGVLTVERMKEALMMCDRDRPVHGQVSGYSLALYAMGFFDSPDLVSVPDVSAEEAGEILAEYFTEISEEQIPSDYHIAASRERYLLVVGDPLFPKHFAVVADRRNVRPYFSKLPFFGAGYDDLNELMDEFAGVDGVSREDVHFFRKDWYGQIPPSAVGKIYIVKHH